VIRKKLRGAQGCQGEMVEKEGRGTDRSGKKASHNVKTALTGWIKKRDRNWEGSKGV